LSFSQKLFLFIYKVVSEDSLSALLLLKNAVFLLDPEPLCLLLSLDAEG
jgi:hypothetical protein